MRAKQLLLGVLLATLVLSGITASAFSWMEVGEGAAAGAVGGAIAGTAIVPGIGTLIGAGIGALGGALSAAVVQLLSQAPTTSSSSTNWQAYAENTYYQMYEQSVAIADNEINIINVMKQTATVYTVTAQKYEQVNYNINVSPSSPKEFYGLLAGTGFLQTAFEEIGSPQELWVEAQGEVNSLNNVLEQGGYKICYNVNPNTTATFDLASGTYLIIVQGTVTLSSTSITLVCDNGQTVNQAVSNPNSYSMSSGYYLVQVSGATLEMNPNDGAALVFAYSGNSYAPVSVNFNQPSQIYLQGPPNYVIILQNNIPLPSLSPFYVAEEIAIQMLAAAQTEYTTLKTLGYTSASQLPPNFQLPVINMNVPLNFTNVSSLQQYNLLMSEYVDYLLAINKTLSQLQQEGKLLGMQNLTFSFPNPIQYYGEQGGFVFGGTIQTPYGTLPNGTYLIQPYGSPLSLSQYGGTVPQGGAVAYQLIKTPDGYVLGNYTILPPYSHLYGNVTNPGTLYPVTQPEPQQNLPSNVTYSPITSTTSTSSSSSSSSTLSNIVQYLESHPLVLIVTAFFGLIIIVALIRALL